MTLHGTLPVRTRWAAAGCIGMCSMLTVLAMSLPSVGLPTIARTLQIGDGASIGLVLACQAALAAVLLPLAGVGDWLGHRRVCALGLWIVVIGSLACALGNSFAVLMVARVVQGIGCAAIFAVCSALIRDSYPPEQLGRGLANNSMVVSVSAAITPPIAGVLLMAGSWRLLFVVPAVFAVGTLLFGVRALPRSAPGAHPPDLRSAALIALTFGPFVLGINLLSQHASLIAGFLAVAGGLVAGVVLLRQQHQLESPLLPLDLLRVPALGLSVATAFASFSAQNVALVALPFILQNTMHYGAATAGALLSIWPAAVLVATAFSGTLADRVSTERLGTLGLAITGAGFGLAALGGEASPWLLGAAFAVVGSGIGLFQVPNNRLIVGSAPLHRRGMVGGLQATTRIIGQSMGAAGAAFLLQDSSHPLRPLAVASILAVGAALVSALRLRRP